MIKVKAEGSDPTKFLGLLIVGVILAAISLVLLTTFKSAPKLPLIISYVEDNSDSTPTDHACLDQAIKAAIGKAADQVEFRYIKTGDESTAFEPVQPVQPLKIKKGDMAWSAGPNAINKLVEQFISNINQSSQDKPADKSPLFISIERAVSELRSRENTERVVVVECDLEDNTVPALMRAFKETPGTKLKNLPQIDNNNISVRFVSIQSTIGKITEGRGSKKSFTPPRTPERIKRLQEVWKACFTNPDLVSFSSSCADPLQ